MSAVQRQDLIARHGVPLVLTLDIEGDQMGKTVTFRASARGSADDADPAVEVQMAVGTYDPTSATTPISLVLPDADPGNPSVADFVPGVVYVYRVQIAGAPPVAWGTVDIAAEWVA